jgi:hypothetical protein
MNTNNASLPCGKLCDYLALKAVSSLHFPLEGYSKVSVFNQ